MEETVILFCYYKITVPAIYCYERLKKLNPDIPIIPLSYGNIPFLNWVQLKTPFEDMWRNSDFFRYHLLKQTNIRAKRYIFIEYDVLTQLPLKEAMKDVWDSDFATHLFEQTSVASGWEWTREIPTMPIEIQPYTYACGTTIHLFSHKALKELTKCQYQNMDIFCELRIGTLMNYLGYSADIFNFSKTITFAEYQIEKQNYPTIYHPVKNIKKIQFLEN